MLLIVTQMIQVSIDSSVIDKSAGIILTALSGICTFDLARYFPNPKWEMTAALLFLVVRSLVLVRFTHAWGLVEFSAFMDSALIRFVVYFAALELALYGMWQRHLEQKKDRRIRR